MYEKYLELLEEAGKIRNLKERSINCYKNYVSYFLKYQGKNPEALTCQDVRIFLSRKNTYHFRISSISYMQFNIFTFVLLAIPQLFKHNIIL
ncbi:phage integrase N-terminal SAM-like domain-containing protein [Extibacter muris]|jgi:integrase/recombinase XerD|uniref:phage integrase N-terminal SAM-like domain-containing protein n=1 Tax=Extibacter muris TaxID=1796622 RepID=UPI0021C9CB13|nr:phage integrase N-terminal SAM-like domain-containing protein [Extibacter muris]MCU0078033.1 phage integrase N-terminal SAM-like domain-containing protein [Extibacter muris]